MKTKPRILIFSTAYYPMVGGAEVAIKEITDRLGGEFDFDLITARFDKKLPGKEKVGKVTVYRLGNGNSFWDKMLLPFRGAYAISKLHKKHEYSCMWAVMVTWASGAPYIWNIFRGLIGRKKVPIILNLQEGDSEEHLNYRWAGLINLSWKLALRNTDFLTGLSNFLLKRGIKNGYKGEYALVPNGVDVEIFAREVSDKTKTEIKNKLGKKEGDVFLITTSRLVHKNANDEVISALKLLPKNVNFVIIGKGPLGSRLQKQAHDLGVADRVKFLGYVPHADIPKYFSISDIFIRPSRSEGFGASFPEAMAAGLPVITTPVGGIPDFIDDRETGIFCSPDNPRSIAEAVKLLLREPELKRRIIEKAKQRAVENYSWESIAEKMITVFNKFL